MLRFLFPQKNIALSIQFLLESSWAPKPPWFPLPTFLLSMSQATKRISAGVSRETTIAVCAGNSEAFLFATPGCHVKEAKGISRLLFSSPLANVKFPAMRFRECQMLCQRFSDDLAGEQEVSDISLQTGFPAQFCPQKWCKGLWEKPNCAVIFSCTPVSTYKRPEVWNILKLILFGFIPVWSVWHPSLEYYSYSMQHIVPFSFCACTREIQI